MKNPQNLLFSHDDDKDELVTLIPPRLLPDSSPLVMSQDDDFKKQQKQEKNQEKITGKLPVVVMFCKNANISVCHFLCDDDTFGGENVEPELLHKHAFL